MDRTHQHPVKASVLLGLAGLATLLVLLFGSGQAQASETTYCGGWLGPRGECAGAARWFNNMYGWGEQGSVCIFNGVSGAKCSGGPKQGVYNPVGELIWAIPGISNQLWKQNNFVHGITFAP